MAEWKQVLLQWLQVLIEARPFPPDAFTYDSPSCSLSCFSTCISGYFLNTPSCALLLSLPETPFYHRTIWITPLLPLIVLIKFQLLSEAYQNYYVTTSIALHIPNVSVLFIYLCTVVTSVRPALVLIIVLSTSFC